ncbi:hypothetical protein B5G43_05475 [Flavonifractor sp. An92]|uniref:efflux RND transporter periplasmic adaptor subunit n=1 Tax=Flavonifractor sp. An92 TaxID=1965666 RepID=UPI000B374578|nr:HlyD family efflux transporter periplasmic adaptor subunit [Flavonifractor sp. An92]OUN07384.1 hypothetical protein B5G43_05475 [Flavonifractor sp. An92]
MTEQQTPVSTPVENVPEVTAPPKPNKKRRRKKTLSRVLAAVLVLALAGGGGFVVWKFAFTDKPKEKGEMMLGTVDIGSISSMVQGTGNVAAKSASTITLTSPGTVSQVFVTEGQQVAKGDPLYTIRSQAAEETLKSAQESLKTLQEDMNKLNEELGKLTVQAPFSGKLMNVEDLQVGDTLSKDGRVATLVNDKKLRLSLYFSYAYENSISVGQSAKVSIPAVMKDYTGTVEKINKVSFITPEGSKCFEVVFVLDNPGTLTQDMDATVSLTAADGTTIYPYENGKLEYYESRELTAKANGPVEKVNLLNYADVTAGQTLVVQGDDEIRDQIRAKNEELVAAQKKVEEAQKALSDFNAVAPIDGTVVSLGIAAGEEVESGKVAISIADTSVMKVVIDVDQRNIAFIEKGQMIDLTDWNGNTYMGVVESISLEPKADSSVTVFPVTLSVDNFDGSLRNGVSVDYSFAASQSLDCMVVPAAAIRYTSDADGNTMPIVYLQAEERPENAIDLPEPEPGMEDSVDAPPEGFYAVPVETGLSDPANAEIKSGLEVGDVIFITYQNTEGMAYG